MIKIGQNASNFIHILEVYDFKVVSNSNQWALKCSEDSNQLISMKVPSHPVTITYGVAVSLLWDYELLNFKHKSTVKLPGQFNLSDLTWLPYPDLPTQRITSTSKPSSLMNFPPIPSVIQMDPNQEPEQATHFPSMASSPTTASGTLPPYFRLNYLPSIPASLIFLSFPLHINSSFFPIPSPPSKRCRTLIHLTLLCSAYSSSFMLCPRPHLHAPFSGSQGTSISPTTTQ